LEISNDDYSFYLGRIRRLDCVSYLKCSAVFYSGGQLVRIWKPDSAMGKSPSDKHHNRKRLASAMIRHTMSIVLLNDSPRYSRANIDLIVAILPESASQLE